MLCKMTEGADVAITANLSFTVVGAALAAALIYVNAFVLNFQV